ncbi:MAG: site-specific integrase [Firmicutes bacterium]|nr:site-specific integrase [Bacillota bacterium]
MQDSRLHIKGSTACRYRNLLDSHILPHFGGRRIDSITTTEINAFLADKLQSGRLDKSGGLSPAYVRSMMLVIQAVVCYAVENRIRPPLDTKIHKPQIAKRDLPILTPLEQSRLVSYCCSDPGPTEIGVLLSLYAGLRIGEVCALEWSDIDFSTGILSVRKTVARVRSPEDGTRSTLVVTPPKTPSSFREIPLCSWLIPLLRQAKGRSNSGYVVSTTDQFVSPRTYDYRYHRLLACAGVPGINYHALRHTFATRCIEAGADVKSLSEMLGHANAAVTLNIYVHTSMETKRSQLEKLKL